MDPLISEYLPVVNGHIVRRYGGLIRGGNCLFTVEDVQQIAAIALVKLVDQWDGILAEQGKTREGNGGLFWRYLENNVKRDVLDFYNRAGKKGNRDVDLMEEYGDGDDDKRTSLWHMPRPSLAQQDVVDFFVTLPQRDKILIALRYFDELPFDRVADILSAEKRTTQTLTHRVVERWRAHARNQFQTYLEEVPPRQPRQWEEPESLSLYLQTRHRKDISEYLGYVTICFRADVSYLVDILGRERVEAAGQRATLSPFMQAQVDQMISDGVNNAEIARTLGLGYGQVRGQASRRHVEAA